MSLSDPSILTSLQSQYICGVRDITGESWAGRSGIHAPDGQAFLADNGAGPHNLQLFVLAPDGTVIHCLPGYWNPKDLAVELQFAQQLYQVYRSHSLGRVTKLKRFAEMQLAHIHEHSADMIRRSRMQKFDMAFEARTRPETSDTLLHPVKPGEKPLPSAFKTTDRIMHERMAARPFIPYDKFDTEQFTDYGRPKYDKKEDERPATPQPKEPRRTRRKT